MKKMKQLGNQGFSMIELMVVVAIMIVVIGAFSIGVSLVSTKSVDECAKKIQMTLESSRTTSMGKKECYVTYMADSTGIYALKTVDVGNSTSTTSTTLTSDKNVVVNYILNGTSVPLSSTAAVIRFDRASGSLKPQGGATGYISEFIVTNTAGTKTLHVKIDKLTGKVTIN